MCPILCKCLEILLLSLFFNINVSRAHEDNCPNKCICTIRNGVEFVNMKCGKSQKLKSLDEIDFINIANEIVHLNLSNNLFTTFQPTVQLIALQKLDLSRNHLTELVNNQFSELPNLRRLDISGNNIKTIDVLTFSQLSNLERLKLNDNQISSIIMGTFDYLTNLRQLDISNNPLTCDCSLLWLLEWSQKSSVKLISNPKCMAPLSFKGLPLRKLKIGVDIHCKSPTNGITVIELNPNVNQVVFEGDSLKLHCRAPSISDAYDSPISSRIEWTWFDSNAKSYFPDLTIENHIIQSMGIIDSTLRIPKLKTNQTGIWNCVSISVKGNHSKGITIIVISDDTQYCSTSITSNNKGIYTWPRTIVNFTSTIPCEFINENYNVSLQKASYFCSENGHWKDLNTSACAYISETTRIFEQFSKVNSSISESAKHFRNFTSHMTHFKSVMDIVLCVETINNYLNYLSIDLIGIILMDVVNNLFNLPKKYLSDANYRYHSCSKLVNATEELAKFTSSSYLHKPNIALEIFPVKKHGFSGLKCSWYVDPENRGNRQFYCVANNPAESLEMNGKTVEASVTIPDTLFQDLLEQNYSLTNKVYNILVSMHTNNKLFPIDKLIIGKQDIKSAVIGTKLVDIPIEKLSDPVFIMLKTPLVLTSDSMPSFIPVWWNEKLNNGSGMWTTDGCYFSHKYQDHIVFYCHHMGYYGLLQNVSSVENIETGAKFKLSHPAIYVGSLILFFSLLMSIITYLFCYREIQMPKKAKHSLINMWAAICSLCFIYIFGIYQTEDVKVCQIVGMLIHYFTISSLLWMCVGVNCMYKRLCKTDSIDLQDDELPTDKPIKKPIIGLYFVGWGVAMIICGLSAAINIREYSSPNYCFLRIGPPLSALYIPFSIIFIFLSILFLLIRCAICNLDANGHLSEGTQATENVDLDLLEPNFPNTDLRSIQSASSKTASSEVEDPEHAPSAQLNAYMIFLLLYILAWLCCAFATSVPYHFIKFEQDFFGIAYAVLATGLSTFTLFFYCVARSDVRTQWVILSRWIRRKHCIRSRNVSDATQNVPQIQIQTLPITNPIIGEVHLISRSGSPNSSHTKSNSHTSNVLKTVADLNGQSYNEIEGVKINNVNLIVLHRQQYRNNIIPNIIENPTNAAQVFYNPHQSTVARKFFKRQKRHMMKRNNLTARPHDQNSDTASALSDIMQSKDHSNVGQSIFGTNSKVNNTNIHVEHIYKKHQKNPNIFSDMLDDSDSIDEVPVENLMVNTKHLRKKDTLKHKIAKIYNNPCNNMNSVENNMRSVSQQCTLEYSSENISDSVLDQKSPNDIDLPSQGCVLTESNETVTSIGCQNSPIGNLSVLFDEHPAYVVNNDKLRNDTLFMSLHCEYRPLNKHNVRGNVSIVDSSTSQSNNRVPKIYINPTHDLIKGVQIRTMNSSMSVSDLDELYQKIHRDSKSQYISNYKHSKQSPYLSDSDINSYSCNNKFKVKSSFSDENVNDDVETAV